MDSDKPDFLKSILHSNYEQQDEKKHVRYNAHEGIVFCVELSKSMYQPCPELDGKPQLLEIVESLLELMEQLVVVMPDTGVGCYFFNCAHPDAKAGIYELFPLRDINVKHMKKLFKLLDGFRLGQYKLKDEIPFDETMPSSLDTMFTTIQDQFLLEVPHQRIYTTKKLFFFTDNDTPPDASDLQSRTRLRKVVDDLRDYYVNFMTFFIGSQTRPFNETFYSEILKLGSATINNYTGPSTLPITAPFIRSKVLSKKEVKRLRYSCPLILDEVQEMVISIKGYALTSYEKPGSKYKYVYQFEHLQKEASSRRAYLDPETGEEVSDNVTSAYQIGNDYIDFSDDEQQLVSNQYSPFDTPYLRLLGFRSTSDILHFYDNIQSATFVIPDDSIYQNSSAALASLHRCAFQKQKSAILWGKVRTSSMPALFALIPTSKSEPNEGFYLIRLPFKEELRKFPSATLHPVNDGGDEKLSSSDYSVLQKISMRIIDHLVLNGPYVPAHFKNPAIVTHFRLLADHLFEVPAEGPLEDDTITRLEALRKKITSDPESTLSRYIKHWNVFYTRLANQKPLDIRPSSCYSKRRKPSSAA